MFEIFVNKDISKNDLFKTKIYICAAHMLKIIISKVKKIKVDAKYEKNFAFIHSFTVLQTSTTIEKFDLNLEHIYNIFNREFVLKEVTESIDYMKIQLQSKENEFNFDYFKRDFIKNNNSERISFVQVIEEENVKKHSPFATYYEHKLKNYSNKPIDVTMNIIIHNYLM